MEYLKNRSPASPRATAPTTAAPRIPIQRSQSIGADGGGPVRLDAPPAVKSGSGVRVSARAGADAGGTGGRGGRPSGRAAIGGGTDGRSPGAIAGSGLLTIGGAGPSGAGAGRSTAAASAV